MHGAVYERTGAAGGSKVHERPGVDVREAEDVARLEVAVHPAARVQLLQLLCDVGQRLHSHEEVRIICHIPSVCLFPTAGIDMIRHASGRMK